MLPAERLLKITEMLYGKDTGIMSITELQATMGASATTIRQDLARLEEMGLLQRIRGGAIAKHHAGPWDLFDARHEQSGQEKESIGWAAAQLVSDGESLLLDAGATTPYIARYLTPRKNITVITNSLAMVDELIGSPQIKTVLLGGEVLCSERVTSGPEVLRALVDCPVDRFFLSAAGLTLEKGATDPGIWNVQIKQAMIAAAREIVLVADSSKWGVDAGFPVAALHDIQRLVVDDGMGSPVIDAIERAGVEVVTPGRLRARSVLAQYLATV